jgi:DNA-binding beta-propeller fold protein YncE
MADVGSLTIDAISVVQGAPIVFTYSVPAAEASDSNWIGIWTADGGGAPVDGEYVASQITYQYAPGTSGSVTISSGLLPPNTDYVAYYLYNDGYTSLASPVSFTVEVGEQLPVPRFRDDFGRNGRIRLDSPVGLTLDERGRFWVADTGSRDVRVFNRRGHALGAIGGRILRAPEDVAVSGGRAYVADADRNTVTVFDGRGRHLGEIGQGAVEKPRGVTVDARGRLLVADVGNNRVAVFNPSSGALITSITDEIHIPFGFCVAGSRTWVVSSSRQFDGDCGVTAYVDDLPTVTLGYGQHSVFGALSNPAHVAIDRAGLVLVSDPDFGFVSRFRDNGPFVGEFGTHGRGLLRFPHGVLVGHHGDIYVADTGNGRIARFEGSR